jgi:ribosomal protein S6
MSKKEIEVEIEDSEPRVYEIGYHITPSIPQDDVALVVNTIKDIIESFGGMVFMDENPELIKLAYPMDHIVSNKKSIFDSAYFGWIKFQTVPEQILKIKSEIEKNESIFRFLIIKTVKENTLSNKMTVKINKTVNTDKSAKDTKEMKKEKKEEISEEEVNKAIEELVAE